VINSFLFLSALLLSINLTGQSKTKTNCYRETAGKDVKIFTKSLYYPRYKDGDRELSLFLADNMNLSKIFKSIPDTVSVLEDSVKVRFVISKKAEMSDISINTKWNVLSSELKKVFIISSCDWIPGGTEMYLPVWYNAVIYIKFEKKINSFYLTIFSKSAND